jgi:hypothetical protein
MLLHHTPLAKKFMDSCPWSPTPTFHAFGCLLCLPNWHLLLVVLSTLPNTQNMFSLWSSYQFVDLWSTLFVDFLLHAFVFSTGSHFELWVLRPHVPSKDTSLQCLIWVIYRHLLAALSHKHFHQIFLGFFTVLSSSTLVYYMFPLGTYPS